MDRERLDGWCEKGILALMLAILVFGPLAIGAVRPWQFGVIEGLTVAMLLLWIARVWLARRVQLLWPPICWAVLAFLAYAVARYLYADIEYVARKELIQIIVYTCLFLAIINNLHRQEATQAIVLTVVFLGMMMAMYACWQFAMKSDKVWNLHNGYGGRGSGTLIYPNSLAAFLAMLVPLALSFMLIGRQSPVMKVMLGYAAVVMLAGIGTTLSRGGWLATAGALAVLCVMIISHRDFRLQGLALAGVLALAGLVVAPKMEVVQSRLHHTFQQSRVDDMRLGLWDVGAEMWRDHFWLGVGPAHFNYRYREYRPPVLQLQPDRVHDEYLNVLVDWGVVGGVLVGAVWLLLGWGVFRTWKVVWGPPDTLARRKSNKLALFVGAAVGIVAILLHSVVDFTVHVPGVGILVVTLMALLTSQWRHATERFWFSGKRPLKSLVTIAMLAGAAYISLHAWQSVRESHWLARADGLDYYSDARLASLKQAYVIDPKNFATTYEVGEWYRNHSFKNMGGNPDTLAREAMKWYRLGMAIDPYDGYNWLRYGMCLDWLGPDETTGEKPVMDYYSRADELDPNGYFMAANIGWHYAQIGDDAAARSWFERSLRLWEDDNTIATEQLPIVDHQLKETAAKNKP
jgi:O-antigen ligase